MENLKNQIEEALKDLGIGNCTLRYEEQMQQIRLIRKVAIGKTFFENLIDIAKKLDFTFVVAKVEPQINEVLIYLNK